MVNLKKLKAIALSGMISATSLAGSFAAVTPSLTSVAANDNYAKLLQYSLYFYDANMCGNIGSSCGLEWRGNCHTSDEVPGGYHDAGDHVMFGLPQGFTASMLEWSYYEFKDAYEATGQAEHFKVVADYFCDFFKASTKLSGDNVTSLLYQKGDGDADHMYWGPPEQQGGNRPMKWTSNGAGDVAADYAAALAIHSMNFNDSEALKYAEALYSYATRNPGTADHASFYSNKTSQDEIANAAGWLYMATKKENYKNDCASRQAQYLGWVDGWENRELGAACVLAEITGDWSKVNGWIGQKAGDNNYMFLDKWGSARLNCSMQFTALVASKHSNANYGSWCQNQMNYILGQNPANTCFVTGFASNSASKPHHRACSGTSTSEDNSPSKYTLIGALVGGPTDAGGSYKDDRNDYVCNEVAIDYNAGLVGAAAGLYSMYKSGSTDNSIVGVSKIYNGGSTPAVTTTGNTPVVTTTSTNGGTPTVTTAAPTGGDIVLLPDDMTVGTEKGDDQEINNYAEFRPQGAKSATLYLTVKSNDTEVSGAFGTWTGKWEQEDFTGVKVGSDKTVAIDYTIPANVGSTVKAMVFWPHGDNVVIDKVVLHTGSSSGNVTTASTTRNNPVTTTTTSRTPSGSGNDVVLLPDDMTVGTEEGNDKEINNYAEFRPQGAKYATLYLTVKSNDTEVSGAFGTWTGKWEQEDFTGVKVGSDKTVAIDYTIPANVGSTVKAMVFWPHGNNVVIDKVVLRMDGGSPNTTNTTTTRTTTTTTTRTTTTTTKAPSGGNKTLSGDTNCDGRVTISDAAAILQYLGNSDKFRLSDRGLANADCDGTPGITTNDALTIQKVIAGVLGQSALK